MKRENGHPQTHTRVGNAADIPVVREFKISRTLFGTYIAVYACPHCSAELRSKEKELSERDFCPHCGQEFQHSDRAAAEIQARRDAIRAEKLRRRQEKDERARIAREKAKSRAEQRMLQREEEKREREKSSIKAPPPATVTESTDSPTPKRYKKKHVWIVVPVLVAAFAAYAMFRGSRGSINPLQSLANTELQSRLDRAIEFDHRNVGIDVSVYYSDTFGTSVVVFDLQDVSGSNSRLDVFRVLLEFAEAMQDEYCDTVELAFRGETRFKLDGYYFRTLGRERDFQNPAYTIRTFPENVKTRSGLRAYPEWTGGLIGVLNEQMDDFNDFHDKWYLDNLRYSD